jgi:hypothetical protein
VFSTAPELPFSDRCLWRAGRLMPFTRRVRVGPRNVFPLDGAGRGDHGAHCQPLHELVHPRTTRATDGARLHSPSCAMRGVTCCPRPARRMPRHTSHEESPTLTAPQDNASAPMVGATTLRARKATEEAPRAQPVQPERRLWQVGQWRLRQEL